MEGDVEMESVVIWIELLERAVAAASVEDPSWAVCPLCCEYSALAMPERYAGEYMACAHEYCARCWKTWIDSQLIRCTAEKQVRASCAFCPKMLPQIMVFEFSVKAEQLAEQLEVRARLQCSELYPAVQQWHSNSRCSHCALCTA
eukprot:4292184-Prymnesium_polylepis.1